MSAEMETETQWRILIVDDEEDIRESLRDLLEAALPAACEVAASGDAGLKQVQAQPYDLILSDFKMPGMDGVEFLTKAGEAAPSTPRILITAFPDLQVAVRAINEAGIENFFTKPLDPDEILTVVQDTLTAREATIRRERAIARAMSHARKKGVRGA